MILGELLRVPKAIKGAHEIAQLLGVEGSVVMERSIRGLEGGVIYCGSGLVLAGT